MNKKKFRAEMVLYGDNYESLSKVLGIAVNTLANKINRYRGAQFTQSEIIQIRERYNLSDSEVVGIFFDTDVSKNDTEKGEDDE